MTNKELQILMERAKIEAEMVNKKRLNNIRKEVYRLNKEAGFYGIAGMEYEEFLEAMRHYTYEERMKISFAFLQHIALLDNIVFDEEGEV